jgi:hypothetical protein
LNNNGRENRMDNEQAIKLAERNKDIPTEVIEQDILDTEREIETMEREAAGYRLIGDRMSYFRATARENGIEERKAFIKKLQTILSIRKEQEGK